MSTKNKNTDKRQVTFGLPYINHAKIKNVDYFYYRHPEVNFQMSLPNPQEGRVAFMKAYEAAEKTVKNAKLYDKTNLVLGVTLSSGLRQYLDYKRLGLSQESVEQYTLMAHRIVAGLNDKAVTDISKGDMQRFLNTLESKNSANNLLTFAKQAFAWMERRDMLPANPFAEIQRFDVIKKGFPRWKEEDVRQFMDYPARNVALYGG